MRKFVTILIIAICSAANVSAQKYIDHIQKNVKGQGTVTVNQSQEITDLVNGNNQAQKQQTKSATTKQTNGQATTATATQKQNVKEAELAKKEEQTKKEEEAKKEEEEKKEEAARREEALRREALRRQQEEAAKTEGEASVVDTSKKVMRNSYKVNGYRVQAFAGGNSRADKTKAHQIGNAIKMKYPDQPIYVHFYSPRWICRVGNYRSYEEANRMLKKVRAMGYKSATIVRGKITVQY